MISSLASLHNLSYSSPESLVEDEGLAKKIPKGNLSHNPNRIAIPEWEKSALEIDLTMSVQFPKQIAKIETFPSRLR
ncbi:MAG: hypothetical protein KME16_09365 [Scytolyngbya sp. HA4215-MV1]|jgi:hypothetical protein|nr:hypothetical protein [Scytolyngbya sp. HA4215-MV1]